MDVVGEDAIGLAQHAGIVLQAREERAGLAARIPSQREAGGEGPGPFLQALDAEELGAERLLGFQAAAAPEEARSEEHTSELQSPCNLVCRLLLEKKNKQDTQQPNKAKYHMSTTKAIPTPTERNRTATLTAFSV